MEKICFIAPMEKAKDFSILVDSLKDVVNNKYEFNVLVLCGDYKDNDNEMPPEIIYKQTDEDMSFDEKVKLGFTYAVNYDLVVVMDYKDNNYKEYIENMLLNYDEGANVVYVKRQVENKGFFGKIKGFFANICSKVSKFFVKMICGNEDLDVYNSFQLFSKQVVDIIISMNDKNKYLRNFDCWNGFKVSYVLTENKERQRKDKKFWNKRTVFATILIVLSVAILITSFLTYSKVRYSFRATYLSLGICIPFILIFFAMYNFNKDSINKKFGK